MPARDPLAIVREYHEQTKHHLNRFARSPGYLDWATQPAPFRTFEGCRRVDLVAPLREAETLAQPGATPWQRIGYDDLFSRDASPGLAPGLLPVSVFLRYSLGLSAWKQAGPTKWALRVNPSSGNLHPTEGYIVCGPGVAGIDAGVYHYTPDVHGLEERCVFESTAWEQAAKGLPSGGFIAALTSIHWREAWKYGERAFRYCQHDVGHAVAAMRMAAALVGWTCVIAPEWPSSALAALLGVDREADFRGAEPEEPACAMIVSPGRCGLLPPAENGPVRISPALVDAAREGRWMGHASRLSADRVQWDWIDAAAEASRETGTTGAAILPTLMPAASRNAGSMPAAAPLLLGRRSAVSMDGTTVIDLERFAAILRRSLTGIGPPFDALWWTPRIHPVLFVHRVDGLAPGLYALPRTEEGRTALQTGLRPAFAWERPAGVPDDLPLFLLEPADCRRVARQLSCGQDIAADGCFSLGMVAEFDAALAEGGPAAYRRIFWEAGAIGQALYLAAEAVGVRGTGIGCFFDDGVHELLGISDHRLQSLYHFTVGGPVDDPRLTTHPGYPWDKP